MPGLNGQSIDFSGLICLQILSSYLLHALADYPEKDKFDLVFIDSSFMSYKKVAAGLVKDKPGGSLAERVANWVISDEYAPSKYDSIELDSNIVVAHCKNDKLIKPDLGKELFASLKSSNKQWFSLNGCSHAQGFREKFVEHRLQLLEAIKI